MLDCAALPLMLSTASGPLEGALRATETPRSLRAAFVLSVSSEQARRIIDFDPRRPPAEIWKLLLEEGEDARLDAVIASWQADLTPDSMLFADGLRARLGQSVEVHDLGAACALDFRPALAVADTEIDIAAAERLQGTVWLDPAAERIVRVEYTAPKAFSAPQGGRITRLNQAYVLQYDPVYQVSYIAAFHLEIAGGLLRESQSQTVDARLLGVELFFANAQAETAWLDGR